MKYLIAAIVGLLITGGAGHWWHEARYAEQASACERRVSALKDAHAEQINRILAEDQKALDRERQRREKARAEAEAYANERDEHRARSAALRERLDALSDRAPVQCSVPADRIGLLRAAAAGDRVSDRAGGAGPSSGDPDPPVSTPAGSE